VNLRHFLVAEHIVVPLAAESLSEAGGVLVDRLATAKAMRNGDKLRARVTEERVEDLVVMSGRAFLLHFRTDAVSSLQVAMGIASQPIRRTAEWQTGTGAAAELTTTGSGTTSEGQSARIVVLVVAPPREVARQVQLVRAFAWLLSRSDAVEQILSVSEPAALVDLDLFSNYALPEQLTVRDLMTERPRTTAPELPLHEAAREMLSVRLSALPVVDAEGRLLGLLSERELMRHLIATALLPGPTARHWGGSPIGAHPTVRDVMTRQVLCVSPEQSVAEVASLMTNRDVERVPVVREGRLVGFLTRGDIVRKLIEP
jgi:CBS domain-containing protein